MKRSRKPIRNGLALGVLLALAAAGGARAEAFSDETPLGDLLELISLEREILAVDAEGGGQTPVSLEVGERVLWIRSRGAVGVVLTDRRVLAVATGSARWQEARYRRTERPPDGAQLGDRVALVSTTERVLGFTSAGNLVEYRLGPHEQIVALDAGANAAVFLTNRKALGLSAQLGGFFPTEVQLHERLVELSPRSNLATVRTDRRLLIFRAPTGTWEVRALGLRD